MGGLATALRLAHRGKKVIVLEKTDEVGGRNRSVSVNGCKFDGGPTLVMMLDPFRKLFADVGEELDDHLELTLCDPGYRVFYADGSRIEGTTNRERMRRQITEMTGGREADAYDRLMADLKDLYDTSIPMFVRRNFDSPLDFFGPKQLQAVIKHGMLGNLGKRIDRYFQDPRLRMLFSFQTMYLGLSPYRAPWVYATLAYMEYGEGIWYPKGGVTEIAIAMAGLAEKRGAEIRLNAEVEQISGATVRIKGGDVIEASAIVVNADLPYAQRELMKAPGKKRRYSCSAYLMSIDYAGSLPSLLHHNVFFGPDFAENLQAVFTDLTLPKDPSFYAAISSRTDPVKAPSGHENLYVLVPCPNLHRPWSTQDACDLQESVFERLEKEAGFARDKVEGMKTFTPVDWRDTLNLEYGAAFGLSHDLFQSALFRPNNRSKTNPNVYFVGASTVPGNGMPMVLISAELVEQRLLSS